MRHPTPEEMEDITKTLKEIYPHLKEVRMASPWRQRVSSYRLRTKHWFGFHTYISLQNYDPGRGSLKYDGLVCVVCQDRRG